MSNLDRIVSVTLSPTTQVPTARGFSTPCVAAYHAHNTDRMRSYDDLDGMVSDGFDPFEAGYLAASAIFAQGLRPVKIGRRASAWTQIVDLTPASPSTGLLYQFFVGGERVHKTAIVTDTLADICTSLATSINALSSIAADVDAIIVTGTSTAGSQVYSGSLLDGVIGVSAMVPGRYIDLVLSSNADWDATTAVLVGYDNNGNSITENFTIPNAGATTLHSTKRYSRIVSLTIPAQSGTGGTFTLGVRARAVADGSSTTKVRVTAQFAADLVPYSNHSQDSNVTLIDATADAGIAADLAAIALADSDFYGLTLDSNGAAEVKAAAAWVEAAGFYEFTAQTADSAVTDTTATADTTSVAAYLKSHSYFRSVPWFHPTIGTDFVAAAILGNRLLVKPGAGPWALKTLAGVSAYDLTSTQITNLRTKNVNSYTVIAGVNATYDGKTAAGEWADVIRFRDWQVSDMQLQVFGAMLNSDGIPMSNPGAEIIGGAIRSSLKAGVEAGGIVASYTNSAGKIVPGYTATTPDVDAFTPTTRAARRLINTKFSFRLAGAIIAADIAGQVTT